MHKQVILGDCLKVLPTLPDKFVRLLYVDPPFGTGKTQKRDRIKVWSDEEATRPGFGGRMYRVEKLESDSYQDSFEDYQSFLMSRIEACLHCLTPDASLMIHLDWREVHYIKCALDKLLGRDSFVNEIIWAFDYGARSKTRWPAKHNTILWYALDPEHYIFDHDAVDQIPYMAPGLQTRERVETGKTTDVWWGTIVPTNGQEKTGYPTQKPRWLLNRIVKVHSQEGDTVMDVFAGSGTTGDAAAMHKRGFVLIDDNPPAISIMMKRLEVFKPELIVSEQFQRIFAADVGPSSSSETNR